MVFSRVEFWKHSHLELKSGSQVGGDQAQKRLDFEVTSPVFSGAAQDEGPEPGCECEPVVCTPAPLLFSQFTLECVDGS